MKEHIDALNAVADTISGPAMCFSKLYMAAKEIRTHTAALAAAMAGDVEDEWLGIYARTQMENVGPLKTVSGKDIYSFVLAAERGKGLQSAIDAARKRKK